MKKKTMGQQWTVVQKYPYEWLFFIKTKSTLVPYPWGIKSLNTFLHYLQKDQELSLHFTRRTTN